MSRLEDGMRYPARATGVSSVYENANGNLILCMEIDVQGEMLRHYATIATEKDGINSRNVEQLKTLFGWDGIDPFWFVDNGADYCQRDLEATIEMRQGRNADRFFTVIKFLDPPGGGTRVAEMPLSGNRNALAAKYGSKLRAMAGGTPAAPRSAAAPSAPPAPPAPPSRTPPPKAPPTAKPVKPSDQMECWTKFLDNGGSESEWFELLEKACPGVDQGDLTPEQWGRVLDAIETDMLPF